MQSILRRGVLAGACALLLSSCASLVTGGPLVRPGEPTGAIQVMNVSSGVIDAVLISDCSASTYGLNRLPSGTAIPRGGSYDFTVSAGCWDVAVGRIGYGEVRSRVNVPANVRQRFPVTD